MSRKARVTRADRYERALLRLIAMLEEAPLSDRPQARELLKEVRR
jgi:hypothetical protein